MQGTVDAAMFVDTVEVFGARVIPTRFQFFQGQLVGRIAVNFVGAEENKYSVRTVEPRGFQQIHRTESIDFEIQDGDFAGFIVGWLGGAVNDQIEPVSPKKFFKRGSIANIQVMVGEIPGSVSETFQIPCRVSGVAKEDAAQVVINADHLMPLAIKMLDGFGADQPAGSGDKYHFHGKRNHGLRWFLKESVTGSAQPVFSLIWQSESQTSTPERLRSASGSIARAQF